MKENRWQIPLSIALGVLAAALLAAVIIRYLPVGERDALVLGPVTLTADAHYGLIDLNTATEEELQALPGIGEALSGRIVSWREENGPFRTREDVLAVSGVGERTYEKIEPYITY